MLTLVGKQAYLIGLLLEHATQECSFLVEAAPSVLEGRAGSTVLADYEWACLLNVETQLRFCGFLYFRISILTVEKGSYLVRHLAAAQRARGLDAGVQ